MEEEIKGADEDAASQRPRSPRVPVDFVVGLEGQTRSGQHFSVQAETVLVSRSGATLATDVEVDVGSIVRLKPPLGNVLEAEVNGIWTDKMDGKQRVGVKLLDPSGWFAE